MQLRISDTDPHSSQAYGLPWPNKLDIVMAFWGICETGKKVLKSEHYR
jgi:hypothetical protein